jgi:hypothetical protein
MSERDTRSLRDSGAIGDRDLDGIARPDVDAV